MDSTDTDAPRVGLPDDGEPEPGGDLSERERERIAFVELSPFAEGARHRFLRAS